MTVKRICGSAQAKRRLTRAIALVAPVALLLVGAPGASATTLFQDGFDGGTFGAWVPQTGGNGTAIVQSAVVSSGTGAARLTGTTNAGSFARMSRTLDAAQSRILVEADLRVQAEDAPNTHMPLVKLLDANGARVVAVSRQKKSSGRLFVEYGASTIATTGTLPSSTWRRVGLRVTVAGGMSTVELLVGTTSVYRTTSAGLGSNPVTRVQFGNDGAPQRFDIAVDNVSATDDPVPADTTPPQTTIDSGPSGTVTTGSGTFTFSSTESGSTFECRMDAGTWSACTSPHAVSGLADGSHTFEVRATDVAGNTDPTPATRTWTVVPPDTVAPDTTIDSGPSGTVTTGSATFTFSSSEPGSTFACRMDAGTWSACTSPHSVSGLTDGSHTFEVRATDASGNTDASPAQRTWTVSLPVGDTTPPETTISSGPSGTVTTGAATLEFTSNEAGSTFACRMDAGIWSPCSSPHSVSGLGNGTHTFEVRATDAAGNTDATPAQRTWTVSLPAGTCDPSLPRPTTTDPGTVAVADNFEEAFGQWTERTQEGDATAVIQNETVKNGRCSLKLTVTNNIWSSRANLVKGMPANTNEVWASGWFNMLQESSDSGWNLPTFRFFSAGKRVLDVSRQNVTGNTFVRWRTPTGTSVYGYPNRVFAMNRWYHVKVHAIANGNLSTVEVWFDGTLVYRNTAVTMGANTFDAVMLGAEHQNQVGVLAADDAVIKTIQTQSTNEVFADGFESGNFAAWTTTGTANGGTAGVISGSASAGTYAARLSATSTSGSFAYARRTLTAAETDLTTKADVKVLSEGAAGGSAQLLALSDAGGSRLVTLVRQNQNGDRLALQYGGSTFSTTGTLPIGTYKTLALRTIANGAGTSTVVLTVNGTEVYRSATASLGTTGVKTVQIGSSSGAGAYSFDVDQFSATKGTAGAGNDPRYKLLVADYLNKRLLITDFDGRVVWEMLNPAANTESTGGPVGVRWLPNNQILATFGSGEVGVIDVATKKWVWQTKGYNGDAFQSPYDAELLPDGNLAVATRFNENGRVTVYNRATGAVVWKHLVPQAHSVRYRSADQSYNSASPTLLIGGFGDIKEVTYTPGGAGPSVVWRVASEYTHDVGVVENDRLITTEGYYIQKIDRAGTKLWRHNTPDEDRRFAINPNPAGGYVFTVGEGDRIEFRDVNGNLLREWSRLSNDTVLDYPYGIQVIEYPG